MIRELQPSIDQSITRRFGTLSDGARVKRIAAALGQPYGETPIYKGPYVD